LRRSGLVQIDFTENGSLAALRRKIDDNDYHILHFSGHGNYDEETGVGTLLLEHDLSLQSKETDGAEFASALLKPDHTIPLVVLSSCKTSQGNFAGVTASLLQKGIPGVVAMAMSIADGYATGFTAHFYERLAHRKTVLESFRDAVEHIRSEPFNEEMKKRGTYAPLQWLIPNLYLNQELPLVDWSDVQPLKPRAAIGKLFVNMDLEEAEDEQDLFIGRRADLAAVLPKLFARTPIVLNGLGGIGKTRFAKKLVQRRKADRPNLVAFAFHYQDEGKDRYSTSDMEKDLIDFCLYQGRADWVDALEKYPSIYDTPAKRIRYLLDVMAQEFELLVLFDNVETFQDLETQRFLPIHRDLLEAIRAMVNNSRIHAIVTGRYAVPELGEGVANVDLGDVSLNDFWRKLEILGLNGMTESQVTLLYQKLGGNFRALEFFAQVYRKPEDWDKAFRDLEQFQAAIVQATQETLAHTAQDVYFSKLIERLAPGELRLLRWLYYYQLPVLPKALLMQGAKASDGERLISLKNRTLIQLYLDRQAQLAYYYVPPLLKELLRQNRLTEEQPLSFFLKAGQYHYYMYSAVKRGDRAEQVQAFWHFVRAGAKPQVAQLGPELAGFYFGSSLYLEARQVAEAAYGLLGQGSPWDLLNWLGRVNDHFGQMDAALDFYQQGLKQLDPNNPEHLEDLGTTLNNISGIYRARGDYDTALVYLEQSLAIFRKIGDLAHEGTTLNNISQIYKARGDYDTALMYLEQSLDISRQIRDLSGEGTTLNNISQIYAARGDYDTALSYLEQSLAIFRQIGDLSSEGTTLNNISQIYKARGDYDTALSYLEQSLAIFRKIGDVAGEGTTLTNIGNIYYARGDYDTALSYLEQSLAIRRQIGDLAGEGTTLNNISQIYKARGDYDTALSYLEQSLAIFRKIGDLAHEGTTLNNISQIYMARGDYDTALSYLEQSLAIRRQIGNVAGMIPILHNMAWIFWEKEDVQKALNTEKEAYQIAIQTKDAMGIFQVGQTLGNWLVQMGQREEGKAMLQQAYRIGAAAGLPGTEEIKEILDQL